jgi:hypothetical protein
VKTQPLARSPEAHFVTLCTHEPEVTSSDRLAAAARAVRQWPLVAELAIRHRVAGYVLRSAALAGIALPEVVREQLKAEATASQAVAMLLDAELGRITSALAAADVPLLVLKGPALARTLYPERALRPYADLDLAVQQPHEARAAAVLASCDYAELVYEAEAARREHADQLHEGGSFHRLFAGAGDRALIELHLDPLQLGLAALCEEGRWVRGQALPGLPGARMLAPEDQVVQLSLHAHKHGFSRLIWLKDLDLLLRAQGDLLDWGLVTRVARQEGVAASVWYTLELTHALLDTPLPAAVAALRPRLTTRWLYGAVWPAARVARLEGFLRRRAVQFHAAESWRGMLPSLVLMGRRPARVRLLLAALLKR